MKPAIIFLLVLMGYSGWGQALPRFWKVPVSTLDTLLTTTWVDMDNDSLLDIAITYIIHDSLKLEIYKNGSDSTWTKKPIIKTQFKNSSSSVYADYNHDNRIDLIISGRLLSGGFSTEVLLNKGNFVFEKSHQPLLNQSFNTLNFFDLNNDGAKELIGADTKKLYIFRNKLGSFIPTKDSSLIVSSVLTFDFDKNGYNDIAFSGYNLNAEPISMIWLMKDGLTVLKKIHVADVGGTMRTGDLNHDGYFDLVIAGKDANGKLTTGFYRNNKTSFIQYDTTAGLAPASMDIADFTSDGLSDIVLFGNKANGEIANWMKTFSDSIDLHSSNRLKAQAFGDRHRDGILDMVQFINDTLVIKDEPQGKINKGPNQASGAIALQVRDRMFFYWSKSDDDHSNSNSVTYDLHVFNADSTVIASEFDNTNRHRLLASHGNLGTANYALKKINGNYNFEVQAIDNAFVPQVKSICSGVSFNCASVEEQTIFACGKQSVELMPLAPQAMWFSFNKGFLGVADSFTFDDAKTDTVFSFNPSGAANCATVRLFNIQVSSADTIKLSHVRYDCEGRNIVLGISPDWKNVKWTNNLNKANITSQSLVHPFVKEIIFTATASNDFGCNLKERFNLKISKPNLKLSGTQYQIIKGNKVQLNASGGKFYLWTPATSLDDNKISNPMASPLETTEYNVVALDSLGCAAEGKVLVEVFEEAFIPTLFTPNGDGRNDNLKIYGLTKAEDFNFSIFNREGSKLFETTNVAEATHIGWAGTANGNAFPPGTYYWKVQGKIAKGDLLLNGKKTGSFLLLR